MAIDLEPTPRLLDIDALIDDLSSEEKIALLSGDDMWHTVAVERAGIPRVRCGDGPNGVRGTAWTNGAPASCFPCGTGIGASFDLELAQRIGQALGDECRARGVHCLLGPTTNIQRHPAGGRGFETYAEDPLLAGLVAVAWINGVQSRGVMATPKHYLANEQEFMRRSSDSILDERTMHEIYLEPFRQQCKTSPKVFMTSYNRVNGLHVAEHPYLLRKVLRGDFGFSGMIISDWSGTYSSSEAIKAGLDLEMPGPAFMRGTCVERDIVSGKLTQGDVDECVRNVLGFVNEAIKSGIPFDAEEQSIDTPEVRALLRESAGAAVVLLKNERALLPLKPAAGTKIAVIGPNAKNATTAGGGSANLAPTYTVTPHDAIAKAAAEAGASVSYALGAAGDRWLPLLSPYIFLEDGTPGVNCHFYDTNPWTTSPAPKPLLTKYNNSGFSYFIDGIPKSVPVRGYVSLRTRFVPDTGGKWELGLGVSGQADLYVDGVKAIDNRTDQEPSVLFFNMGAEERTAVLEFEAGKAYDLEVRFSNFKQLHSTSPYSGRRGGIRLGGRPLRSPQAEIAAAVELAKSSDVAVVCVGTNCEWESEAYDRDTLALPGATDELVRAVLAANPNTVVVNQSGMPVEFPWLADCPTLVQAFLGGNECGQAVADALFGAINPSGKLPITWPVKVEDYPSHEGFGHPTTTVYKEGVYVGYRHFDRPGRVRSAFPFGYGLSYTSFSLSDLCVAPAPGFGATATFTVTNTGEVAGAEVAQVYVHQAAPGIDRPDIELGGFTKVHLAPGESRRVTVDLDHKAFSWYSVVEKRWVGERGAFEIRLGTSSTAIKLAAPFYQEQSFKWLGLEAPVGAELY
ncbi:hypothetical protein Q8F55_008146 [Vanrija albida]|uniref:beta-glucosidase n=1 Tax=Vanrija albida TaxID=181172 RepID=A0ABR3PWD9_9TREE